MNWKSAISEYKIYLALERRLSTKTVEAYLRDLQHLVNFIENNELKLLPNEIDAALLHQFIRYIFDLGLAASSQARMISTLKSFFGFLLLQEKIVVNPAELLESPSLGRKLPDTLSNEEIESIISAIDLSKPEGERNKAIIEVLYACGLRVSELVELKISNLYLEDSYIRVRGKGNKERLVPIGSQAIKQLKIYLEQVRIHQNIQHGFEDHVFLNRRGKSLTRNMIYTLVKQFVMEAGISKNVSPHTFRHSFATELIEHGADLRAVQEMLGHESILTTEIYTHLDRSFLRETIQKYHPRS